MGIDLELEPHKSGSTAKWLELKGKLNRKSPDIVGNYSDKLYQHLGHNINLYVLFRGHLFPAFLAGFYEEQIIVGLELIKVIDEYHR